MPSSVEYLLAKANRLLVVGPCGAGKTRFASALAERRNLPLINLDQLFWRPGWRRPAEETWIERQHELVRGERWIIEGTYACTLPIRVARAELVVHLDYPRWVFIPRLVHRTIMSWRSVRPEMAPGCPDRVDPQFLLYAWRFPKLQRPKILDVLSRCHVPELRLSTPLEASRVLRSLPGGNLMC